MSRVLTIGDIHEPVSHPGYLDFCKDLYDEWRCNEVVFIGDIADWHAVSFHAAHPECPGPDDEFKVAKKGIDRWRKAFPKAKVCIGNHDERIIRLAESVNIPKRFIRDYADIWETPEWTWDWDFIIDDVYYFHGTGNGGIHASFNAMKKRLMSVVMGHCHSVAGIKWLVNPQKRIFGMDVGTGIDVRAMQFAYGKHCIQKPIISAGVILNGMPYHEMMPCGRNEQYARENY
ncbi:metallophosphoesterase [Candidatus Pacearchaeota archaeon]|nr:metallophosphoesterase [Candidatus Pacearchaeota archaeon]